MAEDTRKRRERGTGSIAQRADGLWMGTVDVGWANGKRNRRRVYSKSREVVEAKVAALLALPPSLASPTYQPDDGVGRDVLIAVADAKESHTVEQWLAKRNAVGCCIYCGSAERLTVDHATPLTRGGTNGIDNVVPACWDCNAAKGSRTAAEFIRDRALGIA